MSGIGGMSFGLVTAAAAREGNAGLNDGNAGGNAAVDEFVAYMKKSLAERMGDAWLASHGLDRAKLKAMSPEEREAVLKQMAEELKQELQQATAAAKAARNAFAA
jgi:hypothetical protein